MVCPDVAELEEYLTGGLDDRSTGSIAAHVEHCRDCGSRLSDIRDNLRAVQPIREALGRAAAAPAGGPAIPGYRIVRELARGGMGVVYLAEQERPRRQVALKVLRQDFATGSLRFRFEREAQALAQLQHPAIAQVFATGTIAAADADATAAQQAFIAMEYVAGRRLDAWVRDAQPSVPQRLDLLARVCDAVHHAHLRGVIHRDLKPGNILVGEPFPSSDSQYPIRDAATESAIGNRQSAIPKIIDFGVARLTDHDLLVATQQTHEGQLLGTLPYMSPEQLSGDPARIDARSDIYALGAVAYELLAGKPPHAGAGRALPALTHAIQHEAPARLGLIDRRLRGDIELIVARALEKDPGGRYQSAAELAGDIRRGLRNEPITARPPSISYQLVKFARRHRARVAALAACVVGLISATVAVGWQAHVAARERDAAQESLRQVQGAAHYLLSGIGARLGRVLGAEEIQRDLAETVLAMHARLSAQTHDPAVQARYCTAIRHVIKHSLEIGDLPRAVALAGTLEAWLAGQRADPSPETNREVSAACATLASVADADGRPADADAWRAQAAQTEPRLSSEEIASLLATSHTWTVDQVIANEGAPPEAVQRLSDAAWASRRDGAASLAAGDPAAAAEHYRTALRILDVLIEQSPVSDPVYDTPSPRRGPLAPPIALHTGSRSGQVRHKVGALLGLARAERARGKLDDEIVASDLALDLARSQLEDAPRDPRVIAQLASVELDVAQRLAEAHDWAAARDLVSDAVDRGRLLADVDPRSLTRQRMLVRALDRMSQLCVDSAAADAAHWNEQLAAARARLAAMQPTPGTEPADLAPN